MKNNQVIAILLFYVAMTFMDKFVCKIPDYVYVPISVSLVILLIVDLYLKRNKK